jgi:hypothetical protein
MPTFSFPSNSATVTKKKSKKVEKPEPEPEAMTVKEPEEAEPEEAEPEEAEPEEAEPEEAEAEAEPDTETDEPRREPTFPDIVILKQTDKNYIVKHNHYIIPLQDKSDNNNNDTKNIPVHVSATPSDLVSPNQIYKGQINKKRGRKPKAGIILNSNSSIYDTSEVPNIILHLKCHLSDLKQNDSISNYDYTPSISEVESYNLSSNMLQSSDICQSYSPEENGDDDYDETMRTSATTTVTGAGAGAGSATSAASVGAASVSASKGTLLAIAAGAGAGASTTMTTVNTHAKKSATDASLHILNERQQKEVMKKINRLKYSFHNGETIQMKLNHKCACFWDTCEFDGPIYYTPIMIVNGVFHVTGCYCSPECALAAILKEQMDTSTKFECIHLLHLLYGNANSKGFKPAPNPNYLLDKYYGNLTIDEYRSLLKSPQMIHIVNKPLTHILPELYEDNNDFLVNSKVIPSNNLKLKKRYKTMLVQGGGGGVGD